MSAAFLVSRGSEHVEYPENNFKLGGNLTEWHSTGLSPGSVPSLAFLLSISSIFFSARSMCVCLVVIEFVMLSIFWAGWVVVSAAFFVSRGSEHVEYPENNFKLGGNLTEWHSTGLFSGSVPSLACFFSISSIFFQQEACVYVWLSLVLSCFEHFPGWLGGCAKWHSTGLSPGSVPSLAFFLSISSIFFSARSMYFCFVGCGLWDSAWHMANLPDRSKCINYRKILMFMNAMIYLHYCVCDP